MDAPVNLGICLELFFWDRSFEDRVRAAADAGLRYAEMWFTDGTFNGTVLSDEAKNPEAIRRAAESSGVTLTNAVIGSPDGAVGGGLTDPARLGQWLARTDQTLAFCQAAGIGAAVVCTGNLRPDVPRESQRSAVLDGLKATAERAENAGIDLFLEPLNDRIDHPDYFLTSSLEAAELCRLVGSPRMKLLFDVYHLQIMEGDLCGHLRDSADVLGHVHIAGHPGRHEPFLGEIAYPAVLDQLAQQGYSGVVALEYRPSMDDVTSLRETIRRLLPSSEA